MQTAGQETGRRETSGEVGAMSPFSQSLRQQTSTEPLLCARPCAGGLRTNPEPRDPALKEFLGGGGCAGRKSRITSSRAFCANLRKNTRTSWLLRFLLLVPKGQVGTRPTSLRPWAGGWECVCPAEH